MYKPNLNFLFKDKIVNIKILNEEIDDNFICNKNGSLLSKLLPVNYYKYIYGYGFKKINIEDYNQSHTVKNNVVYIRHRICINTLNGQEFIYFNTIESLKIVLEQIKTVIESDSKFLII